MLCDWFGWFCDNSHHAASVGHGAPEIDAQGLILAITCVVIGWIIIHGNDY